MHPLIWLDLNVGELSCTKDSRRETLQELFKKEAVLDKNNNANINIDFKTPSDDIYEMSGFDKVSNKHRRTIVGEFGNENSSIINSFLKIAPNQETSTINHVSLKKKKEKESSKKNECLGKLRKSGVRPILKYPKQNDLSSSRSNIIEERVCNRSKGQGTNNIIKTSPSVSFLLPTYLSSNKFDTLDGMITAKADTLICDDLAEKSEISPSDSGNPLDRPKFLYQGRKTEAAKMPLQMSPPSSFSDSDISQHESYIHETNLFVHATEMFSFLVSMFLLMHNFFFIL